MTRRGRKKASNVVLAGGFMAITAAIAIGLVARPSSATPARPMADLLPPVPDQICVYMPVPAPAATSVSVPAAGLTVGLSPTIQMCSPFAYTEPCLSPALGLGYPAAVVGPLAPSLICQRR